MNEGQRKKRIIDKQVEEYQKNNNIAIKCESDQTFLYVRYIIDMIERLRGEKLDDKFKTLVNEVYKDTRGNNFEIGITVPSSLAMAIIYISSQIYSNKINKRYLTQLEIGSNIGSFNQVSLRNAVKKLNNFLIKQNLNY